jgi:hypothetical protein
MRPCHACAAKQLHAYLGIEWIDDHLPMLAILRQSHRRFNLILLTTVCVHLDQAQRNAATIAELLAEGGLMSMSLRHGPVRHDRRMFDVSADETFELGARCRPALQTSERSGGRAGPSLRELCCPPAGLNKPAQLNSAQFIQSSGIRLPCVG